MAWLLEWAGRPAESFNSCRCDPCDEDDDDAYILEVNSFHQISGMDEEEIDPKKRLVGLFKEPTSPAGRDRGVSFSLIPEFSASTKRERSTSSFSQQGMRDRAFSNASRTSQTSIISGISGFTTGSAMTSPAPKAGEVSRMFFEFVKEVEYEEEQLLRLAEKQYDGTVVVTGIIQPLALTVEGHPGVLPGDTILEVVFPGATPMISRLETWQRLSQALNTGTSVSLLVQTRPADFVVELFCRGVYWFKLGVMVTIEREHADRLKVQAVHDIGLIPEWNRRNRDCMVCPGDWITSLNGEVKTAQDLATDISNVKNGDLLILGVEAAPRYLYRTTGSTRQKTNARLRKELPERVRANTNDWMTMMHFASMR